MSSNSPNVDNAELAKFQDLASRWWDADSEFKPLHQINPLRLGWITERVQLASSNILDVGCGGGILSESMAQGGATVTGIDLADAPLSVARLHARQNAVDVEYRAVSAEDFAQEKPAHFDCVTCLEMLEHVPDPASTVAACAALVKPGGRIFFSTLNRNPKSWLFAIVGAEYVLQLLPRGTHDWQKFIKPSELDGYCRAAGLQVDEISGLSYNPLTSKYKLGDDVDVNYMIVATRTAAEDA